MKAILINAKAHMLPNKPMLLMGNGTYLGVPDAFVTQVEINPKQFNQDVAKHLACDWYERVQMQGVRHDLILVDEEGWLKGGPHVAIQTPWYHGPLAGNILIARMGKTDVSTTVEEVRSMVRNGQIRFLVSNGR